MSSVSPIGLPLVLVLLLPVASLFGIKLCLNTAHCDAETCLWCLSVLTSCPLLSHISLSSLSFLSLSVPSERSVSDWSGLSVSCLFCSET